LAMARNGSIIRLLRLRKSSSFHFLTPVDMRPREIFSISDV
jgi:hypothetical protein